MERESALEERERHDQEKADEIRKRQIRLGHISTEESSEDEEEPAPKPRPRTKTSKS
jgi:hypothetical protein